MIININDGDCIAEIIIDSASKVMIGADELVRLLLARDITCAKIITNQNPAGGDPGSKLPATKENGE